MELTELFRHTRAAGLSFEIARPYHELSLAETSYGYLAQDQGVDMWPVLQGRFARAVIFEYTATLGLVDVAYIHPADARDDYSRLWGADDLAFLSRYDGLLAVRLTPLGAHVLGNP